MLIKKGKSVSIATLFDNELVTLIDSEDWYVWMKSTRDLSDNTIRVFMKAMERFWIWSLYNPIQSKELFHMYQARYRESLRHGYIITLECYDEAFGDSISYSICESKPLQKTTINKELAGINSYFYFVDESELLDDHRFINHLYEKHRQAKSFLSSIQIKKSKLALEAFGKKVRYLPPYKVSKNKHKIKYFPLELFDELLTIAHPRDSLIYLLCGACSARIGQALNLTLYDLDYNKKDIWLLDPKNDYTDISGNKRRIWLRDEYGIDMYEDGEHNTQDLQFKYPIPLHHEPLFWINEEKYKSLFFTTLVNYTSLPSYLSEYARFPRHPFLFITKTGKRVHARDTLSRFKTNLRKLSQKNIDYEWINELGLHSLRHMFGHYMAEIYARKSDDSLIQITMEAMGHSSPQSTMVYFKMSTNTKREILQKHADELYPSKKELP